MDPARWKKIDELIDAALDLPESERHSFIFDRTRGDAKLRDEILVLLEAQKNGDTFLLKSAMNVAAKAIARDENDYPPFSYAGKTIASYKVEKLLGAGGMGEVYLAFDEKLRRRVALKILPPEFTSNDERVKRFEMEARAISSLNHPGIVTVYDVGNHEGVNYIATEFVEGKTLRDLMGGKFKFRNILLNSIQICDALSAAHKEGIIHRDIKPENIMVRKDGYAKILDFGLAKLTEVGPITLMDFAKTSEGVIIGTPAYMSPAQISDDEVDHRTDLWSCGVVLYEFLTGKNPFKGANRQETFQAILAKDPAHCSSLNPDVPQDLDRILAKLLEKDPGMGYQSASDLRADLKRVKRDIDSSPSWSSDGTISRSLKPKGRKFPLIPVAAAAVALIAGLAFAGYYFLTSAKDPYAIDWSKARNSPLTDQVGTEYFPSISPDGKTFVYAAEENGNMDIFSQRIGGKNRVNLTGTCPSTDTQPAFSPNGEHIAFRSERAPKAGIYVMGASGESPRLVSDVGFHPSWSPKGDEIVVSTFGRDQPTVRPSANTGKLIVVDVKSGEKRDLIKLDASFPAWSPNGHRIAYWFYTGTFGRRDIATIPAGGGEPVVVAKDFAVSNWNPVWSPDGRYLYFVSSRSGNMNFWRVRIDEQTGQVQGDPEATMTPAQYGRHLSFSRDGNRMLFVETNNRSNIQGVDFDAVAGKPTGQPFWITQGDREVSRAELRSDGEEFLMRLIKPTQDDIAAVSRDGREWREITNDEPFDRYARWSPDGRQIAFGSDRNEGGQVWISNSDGTGLRQLTVQAGPEMATGFPVWSPKGDRIAVYFNGTTSLLDPLLKESEQTAPRLPSDGVHRIVVWDWSPDGQKLAGIIAVGDKRHIGYFSFETNQYHIVVENSDEVPAWLPDSRRFIYTDGSRIFLSDIVTKQTKDIFTSRDVDIRSPFVSRDGKLLYYTAGNSESDIWLLDLTPEK